MLRLAYGALLWLALPFVLARLAWRSRKQPGYLEYLGERFGAGPRLPPGPVIWVHAVSVGETRAAAPLVARLRRDHPGASILLTHMTPTGRATGREIFGDTVTQSWLPWDHGFAVRRFLERVHPDFGLLLETEIWPNLIATCKARDVPLFLVNARLSERSAAGYARAAPFVREALSSLSGICAQTAEDARRLERLGGREIAVTGNIKFDLDIADDVAAKGKFLRNLFGPRRRVWVVGSTRDGEELLLLEAIEAARPADDIVVVFVPRHPQRFDTVADLLAGRRAPVSRRSLGQPVPAAARYVVGDSMGEMLAYYAAADVVLVGGSLKPYGGQNLIEPCAVGRPVLFGPYTFNFESAAEAALAAGAGLRARDADDATRLALALLDDRARREEMGRRAASFAAANRGALDRLDAWLSPRVAASRAPARG